jgi:peptidyl-prolyl cis-trans isomerase SurA
MRHLSKLTAPIALSLALLSGAPAWTQGLFSTAVVVNDAIITEFEIEQRQRFLALLNASGASRDVVVQELVDEKLRSQAIAQAGLELNPESLQVGMDEFAARVNLSADEFMVILEENGVAKETFQDFVRIGVAWRDYVRARFGPGLVITENEIDQALGNSAGSSTIRVLVSEIIIPARPEQLQEVEDIAAEIATTTSEEAFAEYARQYSATATRDAGGRLPWQSLSELPPVLRPLLLGLAPGEVTEPINIPNAVALFQLRGIQETGTQAEQFAAIDYATYYIPGGRSPTGLAQASKVRAEVDTCDDLYGVAQGQPEEVLDRGNRTPDEIPTDIAFELSKLDPGEVSTALTRAEGQTLVFLMLCGRTAAANQDVERDQVEAALRSQRLNAIAESFLDQLRADSRIIFQ